MVDVETLRVRIYVNVSRVILFRRTEHFVPISMSVKKDPTYVKTENARILTDRISVFVIPVTDYLPTDNIV